MPTAARARERPRIRRLIRGAGFIAAAAIILLIAVGMSTAYRYWDSAERRQQLVVNSYEVLDVGRQIMSTLQDAETGQRGYLLTGRLSYLAPYDQARLRLEALVSQLEALVGDIPEQAHRVRTLRSLAAGKMDELNNAIALFRQAGLAAATASIDTDVGQSIMASVRTEISTFLGEQQMLLVRRIDALRDDQRRATVIAATTFGGSLLGLMIALALSFRGVRHLAATEAELAARSRLLQATIENLPDAIVVLDAQGAVVAWNEIFSRAIGWKPTDQTRLTRTDLLSEHYPAAQALLGTVLAHHQSTLAAGPQDERVALEGRDYEIAIARMPDGGVVITCLDVTDKVRADAALRHGQKMEAIGQLTGGMAHDFNNILQVIHTNLDLLADDVASNPEAAARVENAQESAQRAARLTRQLLAFARRQPLEPVPIDVGRLVLDMSDLLHHSLGEKIEVACDVDKGTWNARIDANQLENAIINLAINARDAMPDGGKVTIEVSNIVLDRVAADRSDDIEPGEFVMVSVADNGQGMAADVVEQAFDPFFTTKEEGKGTGLGLSMVYGFIKQSGGHVRIDSKLGQGTAVKMYLPRTHDVVVDQPAALPVDLEGTERVLVVEDNENVRRSVVEMLSGLGYRVTSTDRPDHALRLLQTEPAFDLLLSDVVMPGNLGAVELAAAARELHPAIAILFMSGYTQSTALQQNRLPAGATLLSKPFRREDLATRLRAALAAALPRQEPDTPTPAATSRTSAPVEPPANKHILLVEDEVLVRMSTADALKRLGCEVEVAGSAEQALEMLAGKGPFDILITDIGLPGMSGTHLAIEAKKLYPKMLIAIASGYRDRRTEEALPADTIYLVKPYSTLDLRPLLAKAATISAA